MAVNLPKNNQFKINSLINNQDFLFGEREIEYAINFINVQNPLNINFQFNNYNYNPGYSIIQKDLYLYNHINNQVNPHETLTSIMINIQNNLVDLNNFPWIDKNDIRLLIFLTNKLTTLNPFLVFTTYDIGNLYNNFVYNLDKIQLPVTNKTTNLQLFLSQWALIKLNDYEIKWINKNDSVQIEWAWEYLRKNNLQINCYDQYYNNEVKYQSILACLDNLNNMNIANKELILLKMKKTWSQKKFRDSGKAKKPYHLPLTKTTQLQLEELARLSNMSKSDVLSSIIEIELKKHKVR